MRIIVTALWAFFVFATVHADTPNQELMKTDLLVVTAHPDDEGMMAATMARYVDEKKAVALVVCTHGEGGGNGTGKESGPALGLVREAELRRCTSILGVRHLYFLNQLDWAYTESVRATLAKWGHEESLRRLVRLVRLLRPDVVCTMDPAPTGGQHGHHQAAGRLATEAFEAAADPAKFPELARDEGLAPWRVRKLYWSSWGGAATVQIATDGVAHGALAAANPGKRYADIGWAAERNHRSQGFDKFLASMRPGTTIPARPGGFLLVKSRVLVNPREEKDLFDGIAGMTAAEHDVLAASLPQPVPPIGLAAQLRPRDNVIDYREWLKTNHLSRLMGRLPGHMTVVRGRSDNRVSVEVINFTVKRQYGLVCLTVPTGWSLGPKEESSRSQSYDVQHHQTAILEFLCTVPENAEIKPHEVGLCLSDGLGNGFLDVVPALTLPRLPERLPVDADLAKWSKMTPVAIPHTNTFQRGVASPAECSGRFFAATDDTGLQVLVDVTDDTVVRNIAPDDIKAHWRSTSVEICIDRTPPSENTFSTLKLGIFPQDTTGHVRGARDADARPGTLEQIKSNIRVASRLTGTGYIVEAHIPWSEVGPTPAPGDALGFNVILYHAGKKDARVGEDVGKSRLAWSYWPGVPGRPEVWGMATLAK